MRSGRADDRATHGEALIESADGEQAVGAGHHVKHAHVVIPVRGYELACRRCRQHRRIEAQIRGSAYRPGTSRSGGVDQVRQLDGTITFPLLRSTTAIRAMRRVHPGRQRLRRSATTQEVRAGSTLVRRTPWPSARSRVDGADPAGALVRDHRRQGPASAAAQRPRQRPPWPARKARRQPRPACSWANDLGGARNALRSSPFCSNPVRGLTARLHGSSRPADRATRRTGDARHRRDCPPRRRAADVPVLSGQTGSRVPAPEG